MRPGSLIIPYSALSIAYICMDRLSCGLINALLKILPLLVLLACIIMTRPRQGKLLPAAALLFSMAGDVSGEIPTGGHSFILMVAFFASAHLLYAAYFLSSPLAGSPLPDRKRNLRRCIGATAIVLCYLGILYPHIKSAGMVMPASAYIVVITLMVLSTILSRRPGHGTRVAGALLFLLSDSILGYRMFVGASVNLSPAIMSTYYAAQLLLNLPLIGRE